MIYKNFMKGAYIIMGFSHIMCDVACYNRCVQNKNHFFIGYLLN